MARSTIDRPIVNPPDEEPAHHLRYDRTTRRFALVPGRRPAGYVAASEDSRAFDLARLQLHWSLLRYAPHRSRIVRTINTWVSWSTRRWASTTVTHSSGRRRNGSFGR